jgi:putative transposase
MVCLAKIEESGLYKQRIPNIASFYRLAKQFKEKYSILITRANRGKKGLKTSVPPIRRDKTQYHVLEKVVGDQHIFDFIVRLPNGDFIRPQGYFWFDMRSRYCVGMSLQHGPYNKYNIGQSLRQVFQHGVPGAIYTDWGKPETSAYIDEIVAQAKEYGAYCGSMKEIRAIVRNPQAKPIESHFGKVEKWLYEVVGGVGYCKRNTADPQADEEMIRRLKTAKKKNKILSFEEFMNALALVLARWNKHEIRTEKIIPEQVFQQGLETAKKLGHVRILSDNALEVMFFPKLNRTVRQMQVQATLPLGKDRYHIVWASSELAGWEGKKVVVRYSPSAPERSLIFDQKGNYICEAEEWASINPKDQSTVQEKMSRQNQLIKDVDAQYQEIVSNAKDFQGVMAQSVAFSILAKSGDKSIDLKEAGQTKTQTAQKRKQNTIHKYDKIQTSQEKKKKTKKTQDSALDFFQEMRTRFSNIS